MAIYLGLDASTQSLTAVVIQADEHIRRILHTSTFRFDEALPHYRTIHGVLPQPQPGVVHAPPLMWAEALERMIGELARQEGIEWRDLRAISGSAQQHGSVYLNASAERRLAELDPRAALVDQLRAAPSRSTSPIWMDSSTTRECEEIEAALGGPQAVARLTGSRAFERFTGPQIRKFAREDPEGYRATACIHLVSSWLASILSGRHAPIDCADGSGMNLMDLSTSRWSPAAAEATAPDLMRRLPQLAPSSTVVDALAPYWQQRFGLPPAKVVAWSGDNPCSLIGTGVFREGLVAVSLGTSDTIFAMMRSPRVSGDGTGHVFASPTGEFMAMTVFKNGSLARERVRDSYALDWSDFSRALAATAPGNAGAMMIPWFEPEITPMVLEAGERRYELDAGDAAPNVRALVEGQVLAMRLHSRWMNVRIDAVHATGGAAANREILQVLADVFEAPVYQMKGANTAALGAALRAFHADRAGSADWADIVRGFAEPLAGSRILPNAAAARVYRELLDVYAAREREALR